MRKSLDKSALKPGKDFIEGNSTSREYALYWLSKNILLRQFKLAISAKYIWKNRLRFYKSIEEINPGNDTDKFTDSELELIEQFRHINI